MKLRSKREFSLDAEDTEEASLKTTSAAIHMASNNPEFKAKAAVQPDFP